MIVSEDIYLEHYGKKGMKWGVKNKKVGAGPTQKKRLTSKERQERNVKRVYTVTKVAAGALFVAALIAQGSRSTSPITRDNFKRKNTMALVSQKMKDEKFKKAVDTYMKSRASTWATHNASMTNLEKFTPK